MSRESRGKRTKLAAFIRIIFLFIYVGNVLSCHLLYYRVFLRVIGNVLLMIVLQMFVLFRRVTIKIRLVRLNKTLIDFTSL